MTRTANLETRGARWMARNYDRIAASTERKLAPIRAELLGGLTGRVLEVGAGTGTNLQFYRSAGEVVALEPAKAMRDQLDAKLRQAPAPVRVVDGAGERMPFPDGHFDAVVCTLVLCMVPDQGSTLKEIRRVLKPGGRLVFFEHVRNEGLPGLIQDLLSPLMSRLLFGCHPNRPTLERMRELGFEVWISHYLLRPWPRPPASSPYFGGIAKLREAWT